ncbi:PCNA-interacting partner-like [Homarus americanus]|uniref:PCNA-interacting partner-like n=1 Tax=Homarus americanus TaxID=6706 RepID=UPI001C47B41B|nr:PCNA-interacting partner-like [Homarus americanus]
MGEYEAQVLHPSGPNSGQNMTKVFFIPALDNDMQRRSILKKVQEGLVKEKESLQCEVKYLAQAGWEGIGQVSSLTGYVISLCRKHNILFSERTILLSLQDQYQAIQLCLARSNKNKHGEFMAAASDVMDVWQELYRDTLETKSEDEEDLKIPSTCTQSKRWDPVTREMKEIVQDYCEFMKNSGCLDHFMIYTCLKKNIKRHQELCKDIFSKVYLIESVNQISAMERELLKLMLHGSQIFKVSTEFPMTHDASTASLDFNMSGIVENDVLPSSSARDDDEEQLNESRNHTYDEAVNVEVDIIDSTLTDYVNGVNTSPCKNFIASESESYIEKLIFAHLRLLINTRDEMAFTLACSMPGREIKQQGFTDIRVEAQKKNMPMYQTVLSFIMRQRLGGKGYQTEPNNPVLLHVKPLEEFVDSLMKLQNIVEEEPNPGKAALQILSAIKSILVRMRGRVLKQSAIEKVWGSLNLALSHLLDMAPEADEPETHIKLHQTTGSLRPCLRLLIQLCDEASGHFSDTGIVDALGENYLTQCNSSKKYSSPIRIPTVLSLFRSPAEAENRDMEVADEEDSLLKRVMKKTGCGVTPASVPEKYYSGCAWAPHNLSPINKGTVNFPSTSPIIGPTLKAMGKKKKPDQHWRDIVESVSQTQDVEEERVSESSLVKTSMSKTINKKTVNETTKEKCSKRSLLSDISNVDKKSESEKLKPAKKVAKRNNKKKPLPKDQKAITSYFRIYVE